MKAENNKDSNIMHNPRIEKVVINIGVGQSGERLAKAETLLKRLTNKKPSRTTSKHKIPAWNMRKGEAIGCKVTLRGREAEDFLKRAFQAKENKLLKRNFDKNGNFAFGVKEYIDFSGIKYDPEIGVFGMDICVSLERPGFRIKRRRIPSKIPTKSFITKEEAITFITRKFGVKIE